jgi:hypothetical protein
MEPVSFVTLPRPVQAQIGVLGPLLFGLVCGFLLGESEAGYWVAQVLGLGGAVGGGFEHVGGRAGALRGAASGLLFGLGLLAAHAIAGTHPVAEVPKPLVVILIFTTAIGCAFGAVGGVLRRRASGVA